MTEKKTRGLNTVYSLLVGTLYTFAMADTVISATVLEITRGALLALCVLCVAIFSFMLFNRYTAIGVGAAAVLAVFVLFLSLGDSFGGRWQVVREFVGELIAFSRDLAPYRAGYGAVIAVSVCVVAALVAVLNLRVHFSFALLMLMCIAIVSVPLYLDYETSPYTIPLCLLCFAILLAKKLNLGTLVRDRRLTGDNALFSLLCIPLCGLVGFAAYAAPKPDVDFDWAAQRQSIADMAEERALERGAEQTMSFSRGGMRLGGPVSPDTRYVMEVDADSRVYLSGATWDLYLGNAWSDSRSERRALEPVPGADDYSYSISEYSPELLAQQEYTKRYYGMTTNTLTVTTGEARTRTVFTPPFREELWISDDVALTVDAGGAVAGERAFRNLTVYRETYIDWNYQNTYLTSILRQAGQEYTGVPDACFALPASLPERVTELAREITRNSENNYDRIQDLVAYLNRFPYTLEPEVVPASRDFVDYFLFEGREGYCVYYASAVAVMGRALGIPTRYVEGYVMPGERNANGNFTVTNAQAHAWTEVYFPGFGWLTVEATAPGFSDNGAGEAGAGWGAQGGPDTEDEAPAPPQEPQEPEDGTGPDETPADPPNDPPGDLSGEEADDTQAPRRARWPLALLVAAAVAGCGVLAVRALRMRAEKQRRELEALPDREAAAAYFSRLLGAAGAYGYPIQRGETAHAYAGRVGDGLLFEHGRTDVAALVDIAARASFSEEEITRQERDRVRRCYLELTRRLQQTRRRDVRYLWERFILGKY